MHFLIPYMEFLVTIECQYSKIMTMEKEHINDIAKANLEKIQKILAEKNLKSDIKAEDINDVSKGLVKLKELKREYIKASATRDDQFYYGLGLLSFALHLLGLSISNNYTLVNICVLTSFSFGNNPLIPLF